MWKSNVIVHRQIFEDACLKVSKFLLKHVECNKEYVSKQIFGIEHDEKQLNRFTND